MNKEIVKKVFPEEVKNVEDKVCPFCKVKVDESDFKDFLSKKEFKISGLCQSCQDKTFG